MPRSNPSFESRSNIPAANDSGITRREFLPYAAAFAALLLPSCSDESTKPLALSRIEAINSRLGNVAKVIAELAKRNDTLSKEESDAFMLRLVNAFNRDLEHSFGEVGLRQFTNLEDCKISPTNEAALRHGIIFTYYPTQSVSTGKCSINVVIKLIADSTKQFTSPALSVAGIPKIEPVPWPSPLVYTNLFAFMSHGQKYLSKSPKIA